eukprot:TRINITY_DN21477_c0_g1_i1.p3 TRINITY_DN21477_c0_g1~~TRINITY_DN21477_c0_g1_i1.p3  ORF type:complete len:114 (+),score=22.69 TRINITY_DN21477_c0_g1_i1:86-427(+)
MALEVLTVNATALAVAESLPAVGTNGVAGVAAAAAVTAGSMASQLSSAKSDAEGFTFDFWGMPLAARLLMALVVLWLLASRSWKILLFLLLLELSAHINSGWNGAAVGPARHV